MTKYRLTFAAASTAILLATSSIGAYALDVKASVGGVNANVSVGGGGGTTAKASVGNAASATASVGGGGNGGGSGGGGNVASTTASVGNNSVTANVGPGNGPLVDSQTRGNPDGLNSDNAINLGNLFGNGGYSGGDNGAGDGKGGGVADGGNGNGNGNGGGVVTDSIQAAISGMSDGEVATMKRRCNSILAMPTGYDQGIIDLCRVLRSL